MTDIREAILVRLTAIFGTLVPPANVFRNQVEIPETARPAILLFDADEAEDETYATPDNRPPSGVHVMELLPETYLVMGDAPEDIGPALSAKRAAIVKAVLTDATLIALVHKNGIRYTGFQTGLAVGRSMEAEAKFDFGFSYILRPSQL